jgi:cytochrome oxidase Cu insertion factor (SCO1/SenC/PrrC family)
MNSISLRLEQDNPAALKAYAEKHGAKPVWNLLTGSPGDIELLRRSLGFTNPDPKVDKEITQHIGNVRYGNEPLMLWAACPGQARPEWIVESISWMIRPDAKASERENTVMKHNRQSALSAARFRLRANRKGSPFSCR